MVRRSPTWVPTSPQFWPDATELRGSKQVGAAMRVIPTLPVATLVGATPATSLPAAPPKRRTANGEERTQGSIDHFLSAYSTANGFVPDSVPYLVKGERMASAVLGLAVGNHAAMRYIPERLQTRAGGANGAWYLNSHDRAGENDTVTPSGHVLHMPPTVVAGIGGATTELKSHGNSSALKVAADRCVNDGVAQSKVVGLRSVFTQPCIWPQPRLNPRHTTLSRESRLSRNAVTGPMQCGVRTSATQSTSDCVGSRCNVTAESRRMSSQ